MADVSNRDEADKCKDIARKALAAGDAEKALRFYQKAKRMCPSDASIDALIAEAESGQGSAAAGAGDPHGGTAAAPEGVRQRTSASASSASGGAAARTGKDGAYTSEQMQLVQRVLRTRDYYEILQVDKDANEDAVKKAYKKLALKLHPDKNRAPGAEEAFKKLSKVVQCLTDEESRNMYRRYGDEDRVPQRQHRQHHGQDVYTPEDIFNMMFGIPPQRGPRAHQHHGRGHGDEGPSQQMIFQLLICAFIFLPLLSSMVGRESAPAFSWSRTEKYRVKQTTATLRVPYYVTKEFRDGYAEGTQRLADFEQSVDIYHVRELRNECENSKQEMHRLLHQAKRRGSKKDVEAARKHPRPACTKLDKVQSKHPRIFQLAMFGGIR